MLGRQLGLTISTGTTVLIPVEPSPSLCRPTHISERLGQLGPREGEPPALNTQQLCSGPQMEPHLLSQSQTFKGQQVTLEGKLGPSRS